jgi:hypothetical protein
MQIIEEVHRVAREAADGETITLELPAAPPA